MLVSGEIENVPLLDVLQVVAHSKQTGVLTVQGAEIEGVLVFERGGIICAETSSTRALLARAASSKEPRGRNALRRVGALAALTELLGMRSGSFRFQGASAPRVDSYRLRCHHRQSCSGNGVSGCVRHRVALSPDSVAGDRPRRTRISSSGNRISTDPTRD